MNQSVNQEHEEVLNFAHSLPSGLTKEQIYVRIHERAKSAASADQAAGVVPAEPPRFTDDMSFMASHIRNDIAHDDLEAMWKAMWLAAAPQPPAVQQPAEQAAPVAESQPADMPSDDYKRGWEDGMKEATELLSAIEEPFAWTRRNVITDDQGYAIGQDEPEFEVGAEQPESDGGEGWSPLYFHVAPAAPVPAASEGWTENTGEMPVKKHKIVRVMLRDGFETEDTADNFRWRFSEVDSFFYDADIVRWRLAAPAAPATSDRAEG